MSDIDMPSFLNAEAFPDPEARKRYAALVGIDNHKADLLENLRVAVNPKNLLEWGNSHPGAQEAVDLVLSRPRLVVLAGDVGTGKTELAETIGEALAEAEKASVTLFSMSLAARSGGFVGDITKNLVAAFDYVRQWGEKRKSNGSHKPSMGLLFIDEADSIAQSRELSQMHHEDRVGVNALIRGIGDITRAKINVAIILATNRLEALDPAVRRRASYVLEFARPNDEQRKAVILKFLPHLTPEIDNLVKLTGPRDSRSIGYTYSDIVQRLIPNAVLAAYKSKTSLTANIVASVAKGMKPTPPFTASVLEG